MTTTDQVEVTIWADVAEFQRALGEAARLAAEAFAPLAWRYKLAASRDRSRLVTRRKQRRRW